MSLMRLFSGGGEAPRPESNPQQAIDKLRETLDMIEKREKYLEVKIKKELVQAKQLATQGKNQKGALMCLKRKKMYEAQIDKLRGAGLTIETQISSIEGAATNFAILNAISEGAKTLKSLNRNMDVDDVEETMEQVREQMEIAEEIGTAISTSFSMDALDDAELEEELNQLVEEDLNAEFENIEVPKEKLVQQGRQQKEATTEDDEFAALGAEMGFDI